MKAHQSTFIFNCGDLAKDKVSGMTGVVASRADHLYGCNRYWIQPRELKDGKPVDGQWFDEDALEMVEAEVVKRRVYRVVDEPTAAPPARQPGGPTNQPAPQTGPSGR